MTTIETTYKAKAENMHLKLKDLRELVAVTSHFSGEEKVEVAKPSVPFGPAESKYAYSVAVSGDEKLSSDLSIQPTGPNGETVAEDAK